MINSACAIVIGCAAVGTGLLALSDSVASSIVTAIQTIILALIAMWASKRGANAVTKEVKSQGETAKEERAEVKHTLENVTAKHERKLDEAIAVAAEARDVSVETDNKVATMLEKR